MPPPARPPRILIIADNASSRFGGEAILPLRYFTLLARRGRDVRLITHERNRDDLTGYCPDLAGRILYSPDTFAHRALWRIAARMPGAIRDHLFGNLIGLITGLQHRRMARTLIAEGGVDLVHQPTPVSPTAPSLLHGLGVPVVIGPMNGGMAWPPGYENFDGRIARLFVILARPLAGVVNRLIPGKRRAALLLVANPRTAGALPQAHPRVIELVENGVDFSLWPRRERPLRAPGGFRLVFMGRLQALKGLAETLTALALARATLPESDLTLDILGEGPERAPLTALAERLGLAQAVRFHGHLPQGACARHLAQADALILASLHECGGAVVLEAMAVGLPVIASDWGGPADYLDPTCGILVAPAPRAGFPARLAAAMATLAHDPAQARKMGAAGATKVRARFDWQHKIDRIEVLYAQVCGARPD